MDPSLGPLAGWADAETRQNEVAASARARRQSSAHANAEAALQAAFGPDASSAWFMPFNMEPPEIGDLGVGGVGNLDGFANMFGNGGMATSGGGMGGMHRGS
jgi:hypothetical protein